MFIAAWIKKGVQPCKGGMFICVVAKTLLKITKLTRIVQFPNRTYRSLSSMQKKMGLANMPDPN